MPGPLQAAFRKRLRKAFRKAHGGSYQSIRDEPQVRPTTPRLGADPYAKPKPKPKPPVKKHDTPKSPHKEHDPRYRQGAGAAVGAGKIHHELAAIFKGKYEGAGFMKSNPRPGFNVSVEGNRQSIEKLFPTLADVDGVWEGKREQSFMGNVPRGASPEAVLKRAALAGKLNDQEAVFVRRDGKKSPGEGWDKGRAYAIQTAEGVLDMVNPSPKNLKASIKLAKQHGGGLTLTRPVWTRLLEQGKDY